MKYDIEYTPRDTEACVTRSVCTDWYTSNKDNTVSHVSQEGLSKIIKDTVPLSLNWRVSFQAQDPFNTKLIRAYIEKTIHIDTSIDSAGTNTYSLYNSFYPQNKIKSNSLDYITKKTVKWIFS